MAGPGDAPARDRPGGLLGRRARRGDGRLRDVVPPRPHLVPRDVRRPAGSAGRRSRPGAARRGVDPRPALPARDALGEQRSEGVPALPPGRLHAAPADVPDRPRRPGRDPRRRARPGGHRVRLRPARLARPAASGRRPRPGPRRAARAEPPAWSSIARAARATPTSPRAARRRSICASTRKVATALLWEAVASSPPDADLTIAHVTAANEWAIDVGLAAGWPCTPRATSRFGG